MALFDEFPPTSTEAWEERIREDLGEADYGEVMLWHAEDDFTVRGYYRSEDLEEIDHLQPNRPSSGIPVGWKIRQDISTHDLPDAKAHIGQAVAGGVETLGLRLSAEGGRLRGINIQSQDDLAFLLEDAIISGVGFHIAAGEHSPALAAMLANMAGTLPAGTTLGFDPVGNALRSGALSDRATSLALDMVKTNLGGRSLAVDAAVFHDAGASIVQETAFLLASFAEQLVLLIDKGARAVDVVAAMHVSVPISSSYFAEIARLRALRMLWPLVLQGFTSEAAPDQIPIDAETSGRNMAALDPHMNLLRTTTEAASAAIGGADVVAVHPFDDAARTPNEFSYRLARSVQLILRHEAHLDKVVDPAAGSFYVEVLTDVIARRAWQLFKEVEAQGGLLRMMETGELQRMIAEKRSRRSKDLATGRRAIVGVNRYPDPVETAPEGPPEVPLKRSREHESIDPVFDRLRESAAAGWSVGDLDVTSDRRRIGPRLEVAREAEAFEELRLAHPDAAIDDISSLLLKRLETE